MADVSRNSDRIAKDGASRVSKRLASRFREWRQAWRARPGGWTASGKRNDLSRRSADGRRALHAIGGAEGDVLVKALQRLSPLFAQMLVDQIYGEIISRPKLSLRERELTTVAAVVAQGDVPWALKLHCIGMLRMGWRPREMAEAILLAATGGGLRAFEEAASVAGDVLDARRHGDSCRSNEVGLEQPIPDELKTLAYALCDGAMHAGVLRLLKGLRPWEGTPLGEREQRIVELTRTLVRNGGPAELASQFERCLLAGWTQEQLIELLMHLTVYVGWPQVLNALQPAIQTFDRFTKAA